MMSHYWSSSPKLKYAISLIYFNRGFHNKSESLCSFSSSVVGLSVIIVIRHQLSVSCQSWLSDVPVPRQPTTVTSPVTSSGATPTPQETGHQLFEASPPVTCQLSSAGSRHKGWLKASLISFRMFPETFEIWGQGFWVTWGKVPQTWNDPWAFRDLHIDRF